MKFTFGIITHGENLHNIRIIHASIMRQNIDDDFEIIVVGGPRELGLPKVRSCFFDENIRSGWITKKKNIIAQEAKYDNICLMHDYTFLYGGWYEKFKEFGEEWDICMNSIINQDGQRFRDWITWPYWCDEGKMIFLDYDDHTKTDQMYVSGTYFCIKKKFFLENPFDEDLVWGDAEDVEWSGRLRKKWNYKCHPGSKVGLLKQKNNEHWYDEINKDARQLWMTRKRFR